RHSLGPAGGPVRDVFCYRGALSVHAAAAGAGAVLGMDSSTAVLEVAQQNAARNGYGERCRFEAGNVFDRLRQLQGSSEQFDLIVLDPPSFTHSRDALAKALSGYKEINLRALTLLRPGGVAVAFTGPNVHQRTRFE